MIGEVCFRQIEQMLPVAYSSRCAASSHEPSFTRSVVQAIELERQQVLQAPIDFLPGNKLLPGHHEMRVRLVESGSFQSPTFCFADFVRQY